MRVSCGIEMGGHPRRALNFCDVTMSDSGWGSVWWTTTLWKISHIGCWGGSFIRYPDCSQRISNIFRTGYCPWKPSNYTRISSAVSSFHFITATTVNCCGICICSVVKVLLDLGTLLSLRILHDLRPNSFPYSKQKAALYKWKTPSPLSTTGLSHNGRWDTPPSTLYDVISLFIRFVVSRSFSMSSVSALSWLYRLSPS